MATRTKSEAKPADPRGKIIDALMKLAGERRFEDITIRDICAEAGVTLADFRRILRLQGRGARRLFAPHRPGGARPGRRPSSPTRAGASASSTF